MLDSTVRGKPCWRRPGLGWTEHWPITLSKTSWSIKKTWIQHRRPQTEELKTWMIKNNTSSSVKQQGQIYGTISYDYKSIRLSLAAERSEVNGVSEKKFKYFWDHVFHLFSSKWDYDGDIFRYIYTCWYLYIFFVCCCTDRIWMNTVVQL